MKSEIKTALILGIIIAIGVGIFRHSFLPHLMKQHLQVPLQVKMDFYKLINLDLKIAPDLVGIAHYLNTTPEKII